MNQNDDLPAPADGHQPCEDTKRLDWLQGRRYFCAGINNHDGRWVYQIETGGYAGRGGTLRDAIDDAMGAGILPFGQGVPDGAALRAKE